MEIVAYLACASLYAALAIYFWRTRRTLAYAVLLPLALHGALLARSLFTSDGLHLGLANAVSVILWLTVLIYWLGNFFYRLDGLQALVLPLAAVAVILPALMPSPRALPNTHLVE